MIAVSLVCQEAIVIGSISWILLSCAVVESVHHEMDMNMGLVFMYN